MNNTEFKKILQNCTNKLGFRYCKKNYYYQDETLVIVINVQKSNFDDSYYVNYGFLIKDIHDNIENPKINDCDIVGRFINYVDDRIEYDFQLYTLSEDKLIESLDYNLNNIIAPVVNEGIKKYFELYPNAILSARRNLKEYLERKR